MTDAVRTITVPNIAGNSGGRNGGSSGAGGAGGDAGDHGGSGEGKGERMRFARCSLFHHPQAACWEVCTHVVGLQGSSPDGQELHQEK